MHIIDLQETRNHISPVVFDGRRTDVETQCKDSSSPHNKQTQTLEHSSSSVAFINAVPNERLGVLIPVVLVTGRPSGKKRRTIST
jgi:hypothetical protein